VNQIQLTFGGFGNQWTTIDGVCYATWWDALKLRGMHEGCQVEYEAEPGKTKLCDSPRITVEQGRARIIRVLEDR